MLPAPSAVSGWAVTAASGCLCLGALASLLLRLQDRLQPAHSSPAPAWMAGDDLAEQTEPEGFISVPFLPAKKSLGSFRRHLDNAQYKWLS